MIEQLKLHWNSFFFGEVQNPVIFQVIRVIIALILLIYAAVFAPDWIRWFGESGVLDRATSREILDPNRWSILNWLPGTSGVLWGVFSLFVVHGILLLFGVLPRCQVICLFLWVVSFQNRNPLLWEGGDTLLRLTLFLMIFMPLGRKTANEVKKSSNSLWALRLLQLHLSFLYFSAVGSKLQGEDWIGGHALYYASRLNDYSGRLLTLRFSDDYLWIYQLGSWSVIVVEFILVFGVWIPPIRKYVLLLGVALHLGIELSMNLFAFQWIMILILVTHFFTAQKAEDSTGAIGPAGA